MKNIHIQKKIIKNVPVIDMVDDTKKYIYHNLYYQSHELSNIILYKNTKQNMPINLDSYTTKIDSFILRVGNQLFKEINRDGDGIIFRVNSSIIEDTNQSGIYFILNAEDGVVVSKGKYILV